MLELALADSDWRARRLHRRPDRPRPQPGPYPPRTYDAVATALGRATATLRIATLHETVIAATADPALIAAVPSAAPVRRPADRKLADRLRGDTVRAPTVDSDRRGMLRAWAQGP